MRSVLRRIFAAVLCLMLLMQAAFAYTTLEKGDDGSDVKKMQQALTKIGYAVECDGKYGTDTVNAVKLFQKDYDLQVDGKAGDETLTLLYYLAENSASAPDAEEKEEEPADSSVQATVYCADGGKLNLRKRASTSATVLEQIPTGEVLTIYEKGSKWCYTNYGGEWGYVMTSFLRFEETSAPEEEDKEEDSSALKATVYCADGGKLNLRKTASSSASVITRIPNGTTLTLLDKGSRWCKVTYKDKTGYVMTKFLVFDTVVTPPAEDDKEDTTKPEEDTATLKATVYCSDGGKLNLRKRASASASVLKQIPTGTVLPIYEKGSTWCKTSYAGKDGYVMTKYLRFDSTGTTTPETKPEEKPDDDNAQVGMAQVTCDNGGKLNLRTGRGTGYKTLYQIPNLSYVTVLENHGSWCEVSIGKYTGYVMTKYLTFVAPEAPDPEDPEEDKEDQPSVPPAGGGDTSDANAMRFGEYRYATVQTESGGTLNLRKSQSTDSGKVTEIPNGARIVVRAIDGEWCSVYYGEKEGYVMTKYLVIDAGKGDYVDEASKYDTSILTRNLKDGYTGKDVEMVQERLVELKFLSSASGTYDSNTKKAVEVFQTQHNLKKDGIAGPNTFAVLFSTGAHEYMDNFANYKSYNVRYNSAEDLGDATRVATVTKVQKRLRELGYLCPIDGDFEEYTHDAIVDFQLRNGLVADGVLDVQTQLMLESDKAKDVSSPARYYLEENAGLNEVAPSDIKLVHWYDVKEQINADSILTVYDPATGLSFKLNHMSEGRHWDVEPDSLRDTLIMRKAFGTISWDIQVVYVLLPDGTWTMATMHNRAHGYNVIPDNGFGGQNCVHFLRDMDEAQKNDPSYGVNNQEVLREAWLKLTGETITK
ncbi:MAG: SH3 domain-containing protein [Clostridia bacterium]|nr:SH3 domain-containing protein [Clostridia bacterium]